jgi:CubicO group peptidase (beta-lactamase class C family)
MMLTMTSCASPNRQNTDEPVAGLSAPADSSDTAEPDNDWPYDAPENHGLNSAMLQDLHTALSDTQIYAAVTVRDGYIVDEYYQEGYDATSLFRLNSSTKSFTSALIGIAIDQGMIDSVEVPIAEYFPQIKESGDAYWQRITIRHLLTHSSGIGVDDTMFEAWYRSDNWVEFALNRGVVSEPGSRFNYSTAGTHLLAAILQQAAGRTVYDYGREYLFEPLGMDSASWGEDPQGITDGGNGLTLNVYDMAKFGQLFLNGGRWNERQIIPKAWVDESTSTQFERTERYSTYGYQWWIRPFGANGYDTYFAQGHGGQLIFVVPELALVSVFTSNYSDNSGAPFPYFEDYILAACSERNESGK